MTTRYYLQAPSGQCLYSVIVEGHNSAPMRGEVGTAKHLGSGKYLRSVLTDGPVDTIDQIIVSYEPHDTFQLTDPALESRALPATITKAAWADLDDEFQGFYRQDSTRIETVRHLDVSNHLPLPGDLPTAPPPNNWRPSHWALIYGPNASHLVPGVLVGFRAHMKQIGAKYGDCYDHGSASKMTFNVRAFWSPPRYASVKQGRKKQETWMTSRLELDVLDEVGGATLADAKINWAAREADLVAILDAHGKARTCGHCDGRGFIVGPKEQTP